MLSDKFDGYYFGDRLVNSVTIDLVGETVSLQINSVSKLSSDKPRSQFNVDREISPARVVFRGVKEVGVLEGPLAGNRTIVDCSAVETREGLIEYRFVLTGGWDNDTFLRTLVIRSEAMEVYEVR